MSYVVYPTKMKAMKNMYKSFETEKDAADYIASRKNPSNYTKEEVIVKKPKSVTKAKAPTVSQRKQTLDAVNWTGAVEVTADNRKSFYGKKGYIKIVDSKGECIHRGMTTNMGKVFSNYYNCEKYTQSYDFKLKTGEHKLLFQEI